MPAPSPAGDASSLPDERQSRIHAVAREVLRAHAKSIDTKRKRNRRISHAVYTGSDPADAAARVNTGPGGPHTAADFLEVAAAKYASSDTSTREGMYHEMVHAMMATIFDTFTFAPTLSRMLCFSSATVKELSAQFGVFRVAQRTGYVLDEQARAVVRNLAVTMAETGAGLVLPPVGLEKKRLQALWANARDRLKEHVEMRPVDARRYARIMLEGIQRAYLGAYVISETVMAPEEYGSVAERDDAAFRLAVRILYCSYGDMSKKKFYPWARTTLHVLGHAQAFGEPVGAFDEHDSVANGIVDRAHESMRTTMRQWKLTTHTRSELAELARALYALTKRDVVLAAAIFGMAIPGTPCSKGAHGVVPLRCISPEEMEKTRRDSEMGSSFAYDEFNRMYGTVHTVDGNAVVPVCYSIVNLGLPWEKEDAADALVAAALAERKPGESHDSVCERLRKKIAHEEGVILPYKSTMLLIQKMRALKEKTRKKRSRPVAEAGEIPARSAKRQRTC